MKEKTSGKIGMNSKLIFKPYLNAFLLAFFISSLYYILDALNIVQGHLGIKYTEIIYNSIIILVLINIFIGTCYSNIIKGVSSKHDSFLDYIIFFFLCLAFLISIVRFICGHNITLNLLFIIIFFFFFLVRQLIILCVPIEKDRSKFSNLYKLKDLYNDNIAEGELVILEEKEINKDKYDILDLTTVREDLKVFIVECQPKRSFVLGLIGEWGIGKTSTIKLVEEDLKDFTNIHFNYFDPWIYNNNIDLVEGFCDFISARILEANNEYELVKILKKYKKMIIRIIDQKVGTNIFESEFIDDNFENEKRTINKYLENSSSKEIFVIDNLDRINKNQLYFFLNIINNLLNFDGLIFILCYDETIINKLLEAENTFTINYFDKIVNAKIYMPFMDNNLISEIGTRCIINLLEAHYIIPDSEEEEEELKQILKLISIDLSNLRNLTRFINTLSLNLNVLKDYKLYITDFIVLEYIKYSENGLYKYIYNNYEYFCDNRKYSNIKENEELLIYLKKNINRDLLCFLFKNSLISNNREITKIRLSNDNTQNRASNLKIIATYFSQKETKLLRLDGEIQEFIQNLNVPGSSYRLELLRYKYGENEVVEVLAKNIKSVTNKSELLESFNDFNHYKYSYYLQKILDYIFVDSKETNIRKRLRVLKANNYVFFRYTYYYLKEKVPVKEHKAVFFTEGKRALKSLIKSNVLFNKVEDYYLLRYLSVLVDTKREQEYFNSKINSKNIFKVLSSFMVEEKAVYYGNYRYSFDIQSLERVFDINIIDKFLANINQSNLTDNQKEIYDAYIECKMGEEPETNIYHPIGIKSLLTEENDD